MRDRVHPGDVDPTLEELRELLLAEDRARVTRVEDRLADPDALAHDVAHVLPRAVAERTQRDTALSRALMPTLEEAIQTSVRRNPKALIDAIFPILGPAIRKAIAKAISDLVQGINRSVEAALTPRGIRWRMEAWRTGRSYGEVVLSHSLVYRVEQVFLIHRESGLLLEHVVTPDLAVEDPDVVSGMFTAIQDFVRDSFGVGEGGSLEQVRIGELTLLGEYGPRAVLAVVVRGAVPPDLRERMQRAVEQVHAEWKRELESFEGDTAPFEALEPLLESCLLRQERPRRSSWVPVLVGVAATAVVLWLLLGWIHARDVESRWETYVERLDALPGIVVIASDADGESLHLTGLRDPLAEVPPRLCRSCGLDPRWVDARWEAFFAPHPPFVLTRAERALAPPTTVAFDLEDGVLVVTGRASAGWVHDTKRLAPLVPGVSRVDLSQVVEREEAVTR